MTLFFQLLANGIVNAALFALLACAFGLVYRSTRIFHIAFAGLFLIPPYAAWTVNKKIGAPLWFSVVIGVGTGALAGYITEKLLYRPFYRRNASPTSSMVASLGAFIVIENAVTLVFGNDVRMLQRGVTSRIELGPIGLTSIQLLQLAVGSGALLALGVAINRVGVFKAIWAMGDEPKLIPALGLPLMRFRALTFALSTALSGLAGCLIELDIGIDPHMGMSYLMVAAVAVLAGGIDGYTGWIFGGTLLALLQSLLVWKLSSRWLDLATFSLLIGVLLFRPQGVLGLRRRLEEY